MLLRRGMASGAGSGRGLSDWVALRYNEITHAGLAFVALYTAIELVNRRKMFDDVEAELREQLRRESLARSALQQRIPVLAREAGLPAKNVGAFDAKLQTLIGEIDENPDAAVMAARREARTAAAAEVPAAATPAAAPATKAAAVW